MAEKLLLCTFLLLWGIVIAVSADDACLLDPDTGPCDAAIPRYYFDRNERICKQFIWGGCSGVVPFETLEECQDACEDANAPSLTGVVWNLEAYGPSRGIMKAPAKEGTFSLMFGGESVDGNFMVTAYDGCNTCSGSYQTEDDGTIEIPLLDCTERACQSSDDDSLAGQYASLLSNAASFSMANDSLRLLCSGDTETALVFSRELVDTDWRLAFFGPSADELTEVEENRRAKLSFNGKTEVGGNLMDWCNACGGAYSVSATRQLDIEIGMCTMMACDQGPVQYLGSAGSYAISGRPQYGIAYFTQPIPRLSIYYYDTGSENEGFLVYLPDDMVTPAQVPDEEHISRSIPILETFSTSNSGQSLTIDYSLASALPVTLSVYRLCGRRAIVLIDNQVQNGRQRAEWDGRDISGKIVPAGIYLVRLEAGSRAANAKFVFSR